MREATSPHCLSFLPIGTNQKGGSMAKNTPMMELTRRHGHTVYSISAYGKQDSSTYEERLLHLIRHEAEKSSVGSEHTKGPHDHHAA